MKKVLFMAFIVLLSVACDDEGNLTLDEALAPKSEDVVIAFEHDAENPNIVNFSTASEGFRFDWDFGNGSTSEGREASNLFPIQGEYTVTLTVFAEAGSASNTAEVSISQNDLSSLQTPDIINLTGGIEAVDGKTWVIDVNNKGHFGLGPKEEGGAEVLSAIWYEAVPNEKAGEGLYDDEYTFKSSDFLFELVNNDNSFAIGANAGDLGGNPDNGDQSVSYTPPANITWSFDETDGRKFITLSDGAFIGAYTGVSSYEILSLDENVMYLRFFDAGNAEFAWYHRLIRKGFVPEVEGPVLTTLPVDFETVSPEFNGFGGSTFATVDNPDASGINTTAKVGEYVKGTEANWAGIETNLDGKIDLSSRKFFEYKVWSPVTGKALFKLESQDGSATPIEVFADITTASQWETLTFDFTEGTTDTYDKIAMFLDFDNNAGGTFYIDDIRQVAPPITFDGFDFEAADPEFGVFGGNEYNYVDNPDISGINTSNKVGESVHGDETWAGLSIDLDGPVDFSENATFKMKVRGPVTGIIKFKIESSADGNIALEVDVDNTKVNEWEELSFDFPTAESGIYDRIAVFFNFGTTDQTEVFHFDDIVFE